MSDTLTARSLRRFNLSGGGWLTLLLTIVCLAIACALSAVLIASTGGSPIQAAKAMWNGSVAGAPGWTSITASFRCGMRQISPSGARRLRSHGYDGRT